MFERPPDFLLPMTNALANLTGWFNWSALSAIGTVGALWFLAVQSSRSARLEAARVDGTLTTLIGLIEPLCEQLYIYRPRKSGLLTKNEVRDLLFVQPLVDKALAVLPTIPHSDAAEAGVSMWVNPLPLVLDNLNEAMPKSAKSRVTVQRMQATQTDYLYEALEEFVKRRDRLRHGRIGMHVYRRFNRIQMAFGNWRAERRMRSWKVNVPAGGLPPSERLENPSTHGDAP